MMMMMMNCFCGMLDRRKAFSFISSRDHCQRSSPSRISDTPSRVWTCAEPEFRLSWMKLCSSDNHYTTAPLRVCLSDKKSNKQQMQVFLYYCRNCPRLNHFAKVNRNWKLHYAKNMTEKDWLILNCSLSFLKINIYLLPICHKLYWDFLRHFFQH